MVDKEYIELSKMPCYAGLQQAEVMFNDGKTFNEPPNLYLQFVEGCGYTVYELTADEADKVAEMLVKAAKRMRELEVKQ